MSKSLVKQALELCKDDDEIDAKNSKKSSRQKKSNGKNFKSKETERYNKKGKQAKTLIEKYCQLNNKSNLGSNLMYLKRISKPVVNYDLIKSVLGHTIKPKTSNEITNTQKEESLFTEKDFKDFEKTYFRK